MAEGQYQLATVEFRDALDIALQQKDSRLAAKFMQSTYKGEAVSPVDRLEAMEMSDVTGRYEPIGREESSWVRRWNEPKMADLRVVLDKFDALKTMKDPQSTYVEAMRAAVERRKDRLAVSAFFGDAKVGKSGSDTVTWASEGANQIVLQSVGTTTTLNMAKLQKARQILMANEVDLDREEVFIAVNAAAHTALYNEAVIISNDYNSDAYRVNKEGKIDRMLGFTFVHTELLVTDGTYRRLPVWTKNGMDFGTWDSMYFDIDKDKTLKGHPLAIYTTYTANAARIDPKRVVEIKVSE